MLKIRVNCLMLASRPRHRNAERVTLIEQMVFIVFTRYQETGRYYYCHAIIIVMGELSK